MGVWIETLCRLRNEPRRFVTPCMGVWIETLKSMFAERPAESHPVWVCGLKLTNCLLLSQS